MFANMKIGTRMTLGFGVLLLIMTALIWGALKDMAEIQAALERIVKVYNVRTNLANEYDKDLDQIFINVRNILVNPVPEKQREYLQRIEKFREDYRAKFKKVEEMTPAYDKTGREILSRIKEGMAIAGPLHNKVIELAMAGKSAEAAALLSKEAAPSARKVSDDTKKLIEHNFARNRMRHEEAVKAYIHSRNEMLGLGAAAILIAMLVSYYLTRSIVRPLKEAGVVADTLANGDLTVKVSDAGRDETGQLLNAMRLMAGKMAGIVSHITDSSCSVATAAVQMHANTSMIVDGVREVRQEAMSLGTASEEMAATSADIARNCHMVVGSSTQASKDAESGVAVVNEGIEDMKRIAERVKSSATTVASLGERSEQIGQIIGTIEEIADQTNLLALNAAIEAARAGEQGRGFAVVADEVRALAERTTRATREIGDMIKSIQTETSDAVKVMTEGVAEVEQGMANSRKSEEALKSILSSINDVTMQINQIATAAEEQTATTHEIAANIQRVMSSLDISSHSTDDCTNAIEQLIALSEGLLKSVREFKISENDLIILELAKNDHRMFVNRVRSHIFAQNGFDPAKLADHHSCRFGKWYDTDGKTACGNLPSFRAIDEPHQRIHAMAKEALAACNSGNSAKAAQLFNEVEQISHVVVKNLAGIKQEFDATQRHG